MQMKVIPTPSVKDSGGNNASMKHLFLLSGKTSMSSVNSYMIQPRGCSMLFFSNFSLQMSSLWIKRTLWAILTEIPHSYMFTATCSDSIP